MQRQKALPRYAQLSRQNMGRVKANARRQRAACRKATAQSEGAGSDCGETGAVDRVACSVDNSEGRKADSRMGAEVSVMREICTQLLTDLHEPAQDAETKPL